MSPSGPANSAAALAALAAQQPALRLGVNPASGSFATRRTGDSEYEKTAAANEAVHSAPREHFTGAHGDAGAVCENCVPFFFCLRDHNLPLSDE